MPLKQLKKELCKYERKQIEASRELFAEAVRQPAFLCVKCARASNTEALLCKPKPLD
ncbi:MAG: hypothetical protein ACFB20_10640 [Opitutales bacterium]